MLNVHPDRAVNDSLFRLLTCTNKDTLEPIRQKFDPRTLKLASALLKEVDANQFKRIYLWVVELNLNQKKSKPVPQKLSDLKSSTKSIPHQFPTLSSFKKNEPSELKIALPVVITENEAVPTLDWGEVLWVEEVPGADEFGYQLDAPFLGWFHAVSTSGHLLYLHESHVTRLPERERRWRAVPYRIWTEVTPGDIVFSALDPKKLGTLKAIDADSVTVKWAATLWEGRIDWESLRKIEFLS